MFRSLLIDIGYALLLMATVSVTGYLFQTIDDHSFRIVILFVGLIVISNVAAILFARIILNKHN